MMRKAINRWSWAALMAGLATTLVGCSSIQSHSNRIAAAPRPEPRSAASNVLVVRGTAGYWPDCDNFVARLEEQGTPATVIRGWEVNRTADRIAAARRSSKETKPLVLIGYSRGANDAIRLTRRLQKHDIGVDTLILMETATQASVPANVASCLNIYKSSPLSDDWVPAFRGLPVTVESAQTHLVNYNLRFHDDAVGTSEINQFTICQNPAVREMITERVAIALRTAPLGDETLDAQLAGVPHEWANRAPGD
jgi:hypothetical protein